VAAAVRRKSVVVVVVALANEIESWRKPHRLVLRSLSLLIRRRW